MRAGLDRGVTAAVLVKELEENLLGQKSFLLTCLVAVTVMQSMTWQKLADAAPAPDAFAADAGASLFYVPVMTILFVGHSVLSKAVVAERRARTVDVLLAMGMSKAELWRGKMLATVIVSTAVSALALVSVLVVAATAFDALPRFTARSLVMCCVTAPAFCFGVLALVSVGYWHFQNVQAFSVAFPMVAFLGVWNLSYRFSTEIPGRWLLPASLAAGVAMWATGQVVMGTIPKERIASGMP